MVNSVVISGNVASSSYNVYKREENGVPSESHHLSFCVKTEKGREKTPVYVLCHMAGFNATQNKGLQTGSCVLLQGTIQNVGKNAEQVVAKNGRPWMEVFVHDFTRIEIPKEEMDAMAQVISDEAPAAEEMLKDVQFGMDEQNDEPVDISKLKIESGAEA